MRAIITINVAAATVADTIKQLTDEWRRLTGDATQDLPSDSELHMEKDSEATHYDATFTARIRLES